MRFELEHFRTKLGWRIVKLFLWCALLPTAALSVISYLHFRSQILSQSTELMDLGATDAQMGALERLQSVKSELILLATSPSVVRALSGTDDGASRTESLRRLGALTLTTSDATIPIVGDLTVTPELSPATLANLDRGESALVAVPGAGSRPDLLIARAPGGSGTDAGIVWGRIIGDSLWATAQVYAVGITASEINFQDDKGYCVLDENRGPLDCAGALLSWLTDGVPEDVYITRDAIHGALSWATDGTVYVGRYRHLFMGGFNTENWTIVLARNEKTILRPLVEFQKTLALLFVLVFAFVLLLSASGIRQSMEPLAKLMEGTRRLAAQDFSASEIPDDENAQTRGQAHRRPQDEPIAGSASPGDG